MSTIHKWGIDDVDVALPASWQKKKNKNIGKKGRHHPSHHVHDGSAT